MNEQSQLELARLKIRQRRLEEEVATLSAELSTLEHRLGLVQRPTAAANSASSEAKLFEPKQTATAPNASTPPPVPPIIPAQVKVAQPAASETKQAETVGNLAMASVGQVNAPSDVSGDKGSLELRLGTYWLVRIGVVMLLTSLVFFGNFAYQNFVKQLGAGGKVALMYVGSILLLGAGAWWQRNTVKEALKNYAQVLFAGGLAAVYFTTYAAHHIENLRVIQRAEVDGVLLLLWAGFIIWLADRRKSEVLALFAIGLAYYTSVMTRVGQFTLYSNLLLTCASVCFLIRNRWAKLSFGSLAATYLSYAFWRFYDGSQWTWVTSEQGLWHGVFFLGSYWVVFSAAVFLSRGEGFQGQNRAAFLTVNNGAFFALFVLTIVQVSAEGFWQFALIYGAVLLSLAVTARRFLPTEPLTSDFYLTQGLLLVTVGLISKFSGLQLALILAAESVVLLSMGIHRDNPILRVAAWICGGMSVMWGIDGMQGADTRGLYVGAGLGALMMANALSTHHSTSSQKELIRPQPVYFTFLTIVAWLATTWNFCERAELAQVLAVQGVLLTVSVYVLRVREITLMSQVFPVLAVFAWLGNHLALGRPPSWQPLLVATTLVILVHWWQRQRTIEITRQASLIWQGIYSLGVVLVVFTWLHPKFEAGEWLLVGSLIAAVFTGYAVLTRGWMIAGAGQIFTCAVILQTLVEFAKGEPAWYYGISATILLALLSWGTVEWYRRSPGADGSLKSATLGLAQAYRWVALGLLLCWIWEYIPARERFWLLTVLGLIAFAWSGYKREQEALLFSGIFALVALLTFWSPMPSSMRVYLPNVVALLVLLGQRQLARRMPEQFPFPEAVHNAVIGLGVCSLWMLASQWVMQKGSGFYLTASWSILALVCFCAGIVLRERMYRWLGLAILASAVGRGVIFDVWKLDTVYRIISFMALGVVLLVLGFIYSKYQEKIKQWL